VEVITLQCEVCRARGSIRAIDPGLINLMFYGISMPRLLCDECGEGKHFTFDWYPEDDGYVPVYLLIKDKKLRKWS
jgi:hypothetical protein